MNVVQGGKQAKRSAAKLAGVYENNPYPQLPHQSLLRNVWLPFLGQTFIFISNFQKYNNNYFILSFQGVS